MTKPKAAPRDDLWTAAQFETLQRCVAKGKTARQTAAEVGKSMYAVRAHAVKHHMSFTGSYTPPKPPKPIPSDPAAIRPPHSYNMKPPPLVACNPIPMLDARLHQCRFAVTDEGADSMICGNQVDPGSRYCAPHRAYMSKPTSDQRTFERGLRKYTR